MRPGRLPSHLEYILFAVEQQRINDFADATLVLLAEAIGVRDILTLDRRGFSTYRTPRRGSLRLVLDMVS